MNGLQNKLTLSFGGNQETTLQCFEKAKLQIEKKIGEISIISSIYKTEAWGMEVNTPDFFNQTLTVETSLKPKKILKKTQKIELKLGRKNKSTNKDYKDRPIDIDLLFYNNKIIEKPNLKIPHYLLHTRKFILKPLDEIMPDYIHPVLKKTIKKLLLCCNDELKVEIFNKNTADNA